MEVALAVVAVLAGAVVGSATGFGFAIVAAPVLAATAGPETVAPTLAIAGTLLGALTLGAERRRPQILGRTAVRLLAWAVPGMAVGALALRYASADVLRLLVALAVLGAVAAHALQARRLADQPRAPARGVLAGVVSGALATSTALNGPPLVLHLLGRSTPVQARDTLAGIFLLSGLLALLALTLAGAFELAPAWGALVAATVVGWALGRAMFQRIQAHHEATSLGVLAFGAATVLVVAAQAL